MPVNQVTNHWAMPKVPNCAYWLVTSAGIHSAAARAYSQPPMPITIAVGSRGSPSHFTVDHQSGGPPPQRYAGHQAERPAQH